MRILKTRNLIVDETSVRVVPISNSLNNIDAVKHIVKDVLKDEELEGKILRVEGYLINDDREYCVIDKRAIDNIRCPYREYYRTIK